MRANRGRFETFSDCERKYFYTFMPQPGSPSGLTKARTAPALRTGLGAHSFLESWYDNLDMPTEQRAELARDAMRHSLSQSRPDILLPGEPDAEDQMLAELDQLMTQYIKRYGSRESFAVLMPEVKGEVPLGNHTLCFRTDAIVSEDDRLWLLEHKTTWQLGRQFLDKFLFNFQMISYAWATSVLLNKLISGIYLNALRKPAKQAKVPMPEYYREKFVVTEDHIQGMLDSFHYKFSDIESRDPTNKKEWPQDTNRCHDYGQCPFWEVCALGAPAEVNSIYKPRQPDYVDIPEEP